MIYKKLRPFISSITLTIALVGHICAQDPYSSDDFEGGFSLDNYDGVAATESSDFIGITPHICVFPSVELRDNPGRRGTFIDRVTFGDEVIPLGDISWRGGKKYVEVETKSKRVGWVEEGYFISDGGIVAVLERKNIFDGPTPATGTTDHFEAGDVAVLTGFEGDWVELVGPNRGRSGWVRGSNSVSIDEKDIQIATLMYKATLESDPSIYRQKLVEITQLDFYPSSQLAEVVYNRIRDFDAGQGTVQGEIYPSFEQGTTSGTISLPSQGNDFLPTVSRLRDYAEEKVVDAQTGAYYIRVSERGGFQPVAGPSKKKFNSPYYAYHKTLPMNSELWLQKPTGGYMILTVKNRLKASNKNVVGLGEQVLREVYGPDFREVKEVLITYRKP